MVFLKMRTIYTFLSPLRFTLYYCPRRRPCWYERLEQKVVALFVPYIYLCFLGFFFRTTLIKKAAVTIETPYAIIHVALTL